MSTLFRALLLIVLTFPTLLKGENTIVVTDMLLDDIEAIHVLVGTVMKGNRGEGVIFVTADGNTQLKAEALHNLLQVLGKDKARVYAGAPSYPTEKFNFMKHYLDDRVKKFLFSMQKLKVNSPWENEDPNANVREMLARSGQKTNVYLLANPEPIVHHLENPQLAPQVGKVAAMGLYRLGKDSADTGYNVDANVPAAIRFLKAVERFGYDVLSLPSNLFRGVDEAMKVTSEPRRQLVERGGEALHEVHEGIRAFQLGLGNKLAAEYGPLAPFIALWDVDSNSWHQDPLTVAAMQLEESRIPTRRVSLSIKHDAANHNPSVLGLPVEVVDNPLSTIREVTEMPMAELAPIVSNAFDDNQVQKFLEPTELLERSSHPVAFVGKLAVDDYALLRTLLLSAREKLELVIPESTHTGVAKEVLKRVVAAYGSRAEVVQGTGDSTQQIMAIPALKIEKHLIDHQLLGRAVLGADLKAAYSYTNPYTSEEGVKALRQFLERHPNGVELYVTTSLRDLYAALKDQNGNLRPVLMKRIKALHLMGGSRAGVPTRNWAIDPKAAQGVLDLAHRLNVPTYVYASDRVGGSVTPNEFRQYTNSISQLGETHPMERAIEGDRLNWNTGTAAVFSGFDVKRNYGSPLGIAMAFAAAVGKNLDQVMPSEAVDIVFVDGKIEYRPNPNSSIRMMSKWNPLSESTVDATLTEVHRSAVSHLASLDGGCAILKMLGGAP